MHKVYLTIVYIPVHEKVMVFLSLALCNEPRNSFATLIILGVLTFGISILFWYIYLKCQSNDKGMFYKDTFT